MTENGAWGQGEECRGDGVQRSISGGMMVMSNGVVCGIMVRKTVTEHWWTER